MAANRLDDATLLDSSVVQISELKRPEDARSAPMPVDRYTLSVAGFQADGKPVADRTEDGRKSGQALAELLIALHVTLDHCWPGGPPVGR
jgi:hypothetical protein